MIGKGKPVAVLFATPARCQSQYCGPVLDSLLPLVGDYQDRVDIVHVDIYKDLRTNETSPTVTAWNLPSEPWLFGVDATGRDHRPPRRRVRPGRDAHGARRPRVAELTSLPDA